LYTDYDIIKSNATSIVVSTSGTTEETFASSRGLCFLSTDTYISLGLGWGDYWCYNDWYFDVTAGYEFHTYWNQNVLPQINDCSQTPSALYGDLFMHGLVLTGRLDF